MKVFGGILIKQITSDNWMVEDCIRGEIVSNAVPDDIPITDDFVICDSSRCLPVRTDVFFVPTDAVLVSGTMEEILAV